MLKFCENLIHARQTRGYTQAQLAEALGISRSTYANYEAGKRSPDLEMLLRIADELDLSIDRLMGRTGETAPYVISETTAPYRAAQTKRAASQNRRKSGDSASEPPDRYGLAIGVQDYRKIRQKKGYYVDKTMLIAEFLGSRSEVTLITRPRRFGKTLNMSMLAEFLDCSKDSREIFAGTRIMDTAYARELNRHPVVFLSLASVKGRTADVLLFQLLYMLREEFARHAAIWSGDRVSEKTRRDMTAAYQSLDVFSQPDRTGCLDVAPAIRMLCGALAEYYGRPVYLLIDEYDTPMIEACVHGYYEEVHDILAGLLHMALKGNPSLNQALLTGIQRVAKENIFSGLNNLAVCTVKDPEYAEYFGFTGPETATLLEYYDRELTPEVKAMYNGYRFGSVEIYNPWSIINYASRGRLEPYWVNTSENTMIRDAMDQCRDEFRASYEELIETGSVVTDVQTDTSFYEFQSAASLWGLLVNAGMVVLEERIDMDLGRLRIPNQEVARAFGELTAHHLRVREGDLKLLLYDLQTGRMERFAEDYCRMLLTLPSYHDLKDENSCHMLMLGMCSLLAADYEISSNRESGKGRSDILMTPRKGGSTGMVLEFKYTKDEKADLSELAEQAVLQAQRKAYAAQMTGPVRYLGLAHRGKDARIAWKTEKL